MKFRIEPAFWDLFPQTLIGIVLASAIDNRADPEGAAELLAGAVAEAAARLNSEEADMAVHPAVAPWREAYRQFGVKPNKYRSSIENLLRSARGGTLRSINPLVDIYNTVSLRHQLPCGGEDLAAISGDIRLTRAQGGENFVPLGSQEEQPPAPGEIIYADDIGVICRAWNWREADRTKLTTDTSSAFLCIEAIPPIDNTALYAACTELTSLVEARLGATCRIEILSKERPEITISE